MVAATREEKFPSAPCSPLETKGAMAFMWIPPLEENYAKKNRSCFSHCGSFDYLDMQSLIDYTHFSFSACGCNLNFWGV